MPAMDGDATDKNGPEVTSSADRPDQESAGASTELADTEDDTVVARGRTRERLEKSSPMKVTRAPRPHGTLER